MPDKHEYADYSLKDFSKYDCLKLSKGIYALLAFVCRGYIIWLVSISSMQNRTDTISFVFPDPKLFYLSLISGAIGLFVILLISLRKPDTFAWVKICWQHIRTLLFVSLVFDFSISVIGFLYFNLLSFQWLVMQLTLAVLFSVFLYTNKRVKLNIQEFPEKIIED